MSILNPFAFYLLPLLGLILFFYLLKGRPKELNVSSILFWRKIPQTLTSQNFRWRIPPELLLFLQLTILSLLIIALAQIFFLLPGKRKEYVALVMDTTASMQATDVTPTRFNAAKREAREFVKDLSREEKVALIEAGSGSRILANFSHEREYLLEKLDTLRALDVEGNPKKAIKLARSVFPSQSVGKIVFFTDGAFRLEGDSLPPELKMEVFNSRISSNLGITSLKIRPRIIGRRDYEMMVRVGNFSREERNFTLRVFLNEQILFENELALGPEKERGYIYHLKAEQKGILKAEVSSHSEDHLKVDDVAYAVFGPQKTLDVLLVSPGNIFLENVLSSYSSINLYKKEKVPSERMQNYDLLIFDGIPPPPLQQGNVICIGTLPPTFLPKEPKLIENPVLTEWKSTHPLLRFVSLNNMDVKYSLSAPAIPGGEVLLQAEDYPLMQVLEKDNLKFVFIGFDLYYSDFPFRVGFPIFISNLLQWFYPGLFDPGYYQRQTGNDFTDAGVHQIDEGTSFAANLVSSQESNLHLRANIISPSADKEKMGGEEQESGINRLSISTVIIILLCVLLLIEWYLYHFPAKRGR